MSYDIKRILQSWQTKDGEYAKTYLKDAAAFHHKLLEDPAMTALYMNTKITYPAGKSIPLLGGLSLMCSNAFRPKTSNASLLQFRVASANGAFLIYENNCCRSNADGSAKKTEHFLKVALDNSDYMEVEAVALRMIEQHVPRNLQKYFLSYRASANMLMYKDPMTKSIALDLNRYLDHSHHNSFFGEYTINDPDTFILPAIITRVVPSGLSLGQIVSAWRYVTPTTDTTKVEALKDSMRIFHRSAIFDRAINNAVLDERIINTARTRIFSKLSEFIANVGIACAPLRFSHGDLHVGNVMYDMESDNFVMIDYGRSTVDLESIGTTIDFIMDEFSKIKSKDTNEVRSKVTKANDFYKVFNNMGMRRDFDPASETSTYGVLLDLASMTMHTIATLQGRLLIPEHPTISYSLYTDAFAASPLNIVYEYIANAKANPASITTVDMMQVYFALILRAALWSGLLDGKANIIGGSNQDRNAAFVVDMEDIFGYEKEGALFYLYGQPFSKIYGQYQTQLEILTKQCDFFSVFEEVAMKKRITAGKVPEPVNKHVKDIARMTKPKTAIDIRALTLENYAYNMQHNAEMSIAAAVPACHASTVSTVSNASAVSNVANTSSKTKRSESIPPAFVIPKAPESSDQQRKLRRLNSSYS